MSIEISSDFFNQVNLRAIKNVPIIDALKTISHILEYLWWCI